MLSVDSVDRLHQVLVLLPPPAEKTLLMRAARADVVEAHARLLVAASVDRLQKAATSASAWYVQTRARSRIGGV
jgi:hypothetical protein